MSHMPHHCLCQVRQTLCDTFCKSQQIKLPVLSYDKSHGCLNKEPQCSQVFIISDMIGAKIRPWHMKTELDFIGDS